jgi:UDP-glucose 4-epimerase
VRELLAAGHTPIVLDDLSHGHREAVAKEAVFIEGGVGDEKILREIFSRHAIEVVMHFAAFIEVAESVTQPEKYLRNNFSEPLKLLAEMNRAQVRRLVFSSTAAVYGNPQRTPIEETHPCLPVNPYGESKRRLELALEDERQKHGLGYTILRYFNVAGAAPDVSIGEAHDPETHLIPNVLLAALNGHPKLKIFGTDYPTPDGTCVRDYVHVMDIAAAHVLALEKLSPGAAHIYNLGSAAGYSVREVIESCKRVTGRKIVTEEHPRRAGDPASLIASSAKIGQELGWKPRYADLDQIVRHAWQWHSRSPRPY